MAEDLRLLFSPSASFSIVSMTSVVPITIALYSWHQAQILATQETWKTQRSDEERNEERSEKRRGERHKLTRGYRVKERERERERDRERDRGGEKTGNRVIE